MPRHLKETTIGNYLNANRRNRMLNRAENERNQKSGGSLKQRILSGTRRGRSKRVRVLAAQELDLMAVD